jgi:hypothetical protein
MLDYILVIECTMPALCRFSHLDAFLSDSDGDRKNRDTLNDVDGKAKTVIMQFRKPIVLVIGMCERSGKHFDIVARKDPSRRTILQF